MLPVCGTPGSEAGKPGRRQVPCRYHGSHTIIILTVILLLLLCVTASVGAHVAIRGQLLGAGSVYCGLPELNADLLRKCFYY